MTSPARATRARHLALHPVTGVALLGAVTLVAVGGLVSGAGGGSAVTAAGVWAGPLGWLALAMIAGFSTSGST